MELKRMARWLAGAACSLVCLPGHALRLDTLTIDLDPHKKLQFVAIGNNGSRRNVYTLNMVQISQPTAEGTEREINDGSLLWSPQKLTLSPGERDGFKLYYGGPQDGRERYYRVRFTETPVASLPPLSRQEQTFSDFRIALSAIVTVRPALLNFRYQITEEAIINTGNSYFKYLAARGCSKTYLRAKYLLPGARWVFTPAERHSKKILIFGNRVIPVSTCAESGKGS